MSDRTKPRVMGVIGAHFATPQIVDDLAPPNGKGRGEVWVVECSSREEAEQILAHADRQRAIGLEEWREANEQNMTKECWLQSGESIYDYAERLRAIGREEGKAELRNFAMRRLRAVQLLTSPESLTREEDGVEFMIRCRHCHGYAYTDGDEPSRLEHKSGCHVLLARELCKVPATTPKEGRQGIDNLAADGPPTLTDEEIEFGRKLVEDDTPKEVGRDFEAERNVILEELLGVVYDEGFHDYPSIEIICEKLTGLYNAEHYPDFKPTEEPTGGLAEGIAQAKAGSTRFRTFEELGLEHLSPEELAEDDTDSECDVFAILMSRKCNRGTAGCRLDHPTKGKTDER